MCEIALNFYNLLRFYFALLLLSLLSLLFICITTYFFRRGGGGGVFNLFLHFFNFCAFVSSSISNYNINRDKAFYLGCLYVCEVLSTPL